eukprot:627626-Rhodomonas_salina.1
MPVPLGHTLCQYRTSPSPYAMPVPDIAYLRSRQRGPPPLPPSTIRYVSTGYRVSRSHQTLCQYRTCAIPYVRQVSTGHSVGCYLRKLIVPYPIGECRTQRRMLPPRPACPLPWPCATPLAGEVNGQTASVP